MDQEAVNGFNQVITEMWDAGMKQERVDEIYQECSDACYQDDYILRKTSRAATAKKQFQQHQQKKRARNESKENKTTEVSHKKNKSKKKRSVQDKNIGNKMQATSPPRKPRTRTLVQCAPTGKKIMYDKSSGLMSRCCKFAFKTFDPKEECTKCTVAYCLTCGDRLIKEAE